MVNHASYSPDGKYIVAAFSDGTIRILDDETGQVIRTIEGHTGQVNSLNCSPDGRKVVSASSEDNAIKVWDVYTGKLKSVFTFNSE